MNKVTLGLFAVLFLSFIIAAQPGPSQSTADVIEVQVSPHTIHLEWNTSGKVRVTIHADIDYSTVETYSVQLGDIDAISTKADARGDLVAKFSYEEVLTLVDTGTTTLVLTGTRTDGTEFTGKDTVRVVG